MADADTSAAVPETSGDPGTDHANLSIVVDSFVWKYMEKSIRFSADVKEQISQVTDVTFEGQPDGRTKLVLKGEDGNRLNDIVDSIKQLIDRCEQTVKSVTAPKQEAVVYAKIVENLDTLQPTSGHVSVNDGNIVVTGTNEEIEQTLGMLEELYGLRRGDKGSSDDPNSLQLWKVGSIEPVCIDVDSGLWQYIKKPDSAWVKQYDQVRGNANVQLTETPSTENGGALLRIEISGMKDSVAETKAELEGLIVQCSRDIKTVRSAKLDEKVFAKASKFIPIIAKTGAIVTGIDCVISVTGNGVQIKACKEKLDKLNVNLSEAQSSQRSTPAAAAAATSSSVAPPTTREERGNNTASSARAVPDQPSRPVDVPSSSDPRPSLSGASLTRPGTAGLKHLEVPFPIEEQLWKFMQKRRSAQLRELREVYMVNLSTLSAGEPGYVMLKMSAESDDMLEIAQESFLQFLSALHQTIVVQAMETESDARSLPPELCQILSQLINGLDAIIDFSGNRIFITGPREAIVESQQRIASFVQQQQRGQSGMGGVGNSMGMRQPQGMGMGFGMDSEMGMGGGRGMGMGIGSGSMGSGERLGGRNIPGAYNDADQRTAIRNQRNVQFGGLSMYGQDSYGEYDGNFGSSGQSSRFDEPTRSSANQGMTVEELLDDDDDELVRATFLPTGNSGPAASGQLHGALKSSDKTESVQNVQAADSAASKHRVRFSDQQTPGQSDSASPAATTSSNASSKPAVAAASASHPSDTPSTNAVSHHHLSKCSVCEMSEHGSSASNSAGRCAHSFCVSCVKEYFSNSSATGPRCPVCGSDNESPASKQPRTQPSDGRMLVTHDSSFRLPGFENRSRGTITVIYSFPSGTQKDPQPHPGQKYGAVTKTAFFPMTPEGSTIVDQLQRAFDDGLVFAMVPGANGQPDQIDWNGIDHKTNIFGGPQLQGYPDPVYLPRIQNQLRAKGIQ